MAMKMKKARLAQGIALACLSMPPAWAADAASLLKDADAFRAGNADVCIETEVTTSDAQQQTTKTRLYSVFIRDPRNSLIVMRSPAEAGQKVLMSGDNFWIVMPNSERPLRITPSQKLLGDASTGDIASLSWAADYDGTVVGEETCKLDAVERACIHLSLAANNKSSSYQRIELWLGAQHHEPLTADYYVQSDRIAKHASFEMDSATSPKLVNQMVLDDQLGDHRVTKVRYLSRRPKRMSENLFNPMYLVRTPNVD